MPRLRNWGPVKAQRLLARIGAVQTIPVTLDVQDSFVDITVWSKQMGHGIQAKAHTADRWISATASPYGLELAARDGIYAGVVGVNRFAGIR